MQYEFFSIPAIGEGGSELTESFNRFLRGHRVVSVEKQFVNNQGASYWCCCVEYLEGSGSQLADKAAFSRRNKVDYRELLDEPTFAKFSMLRECRKILAEEEAVPAYAVFLDEHLAAMAKLDELNVHSLRSICGVGSKKIEKYGERFVTLLKQRQQGLNAV